jgi:mRNA interferase RelE/StbE
LTKYSWTIEFSEEAKKQFRTIDKPMQKRIENFLMMRLAHHPEPKLLGTQLRGELSSFWRFRIGDYRIVTDIMEVRVIIQVVKLAHRREVYD